MSTSTSTTTTTTLTSLPTLPALPSPKPMLLTTAITTRHSTRRFLSTPPPLTTLHTALTLATHAPSNSNIQPWCLYLLSGPALARLKTALLSAASSTPTGPAIPPLPAAFQRFRSALGQQVYGVGLGISHSDTAGRRAAVLRNFDFFGAPVAAIVCMDKRLSSADAVSVGMYVQTLLLALTEQGVGTCVEVAVAGYPEVIRDVVKEIPESMDILCGVAIGYEDPTMKVNHIYTPRNLVAQID
ncbi:Nitroreductase-like protein [Cercophora scortea]|uniref:Nitroreductase-like protein n=1 Tax=Cercophora scortea TaxID=314031 RepID=A0AAE0J2V4_9PEZI|nr:Nitroreductase-like protein [Cercophora scortea]